MRAIFSRSIEESPTRNPRVPPYRIALLPRRTVLEIKTLRGFAPDDIPPPSVDKRTLDGLLHLGIHPSGRQRE